MTRLADPNRSHVVAVGAATYAKLAPLPSVANNLRGLCGVLTDPRLWGLRPSNCVVLSNPRTPVQVDAALRAAARATPVDGLLLCYFAGHGLIDSRTGGLHLGVMSTDPDAPYATAVPYEWIRRSVLDSPASRRVVILDCCYAGRAVAGMSDVVTAVADEVEIDRTCVLVSAPGNRTALAPPDETYTAFTGVLLDVLRGGIPGGPDPLDLTTVYDHVLRIQRSRGRPLPELRTRNGGERIPLVRNAAYPLRPMRPEPDDAHAPAPSYAGRVLRAARDVADPELAGATVLVLAHDPAAGAIGVRLGVCTDRSAADIVDPLRAAALAPVEVFDGGPVRDVVLLLARLRPGEPEPPGFRPLRGGIGTAPIGTAAATMATAFVRAWLFVGYLGWRPGQLEAEVARGELVSVDEAVDEWLAPARAS